MTNRYQKLGFRHRCSAPFSSPPDVSSSLGRLLDNIIGSHRLSEPFYWVWASSQYFRALSTTSSILSNAMPPVQSQPTLFLEASSRWPFLCSFRPCTARLGYPGERACSASLRYCLSLYRTFSTCSDPDLGKGANTQRIWAEGCARQSRSVSWATKEIWKHSRNSRT